MINYYETVLSYNKQALTSLKNNQLAVAYNLLQQASKILKRKNIDSSENLQALTFNNFGLFYKETKDFNESIKFFNKAAVLCKSDTVLRTRIYLNLSSVYSTLINHEQALSFAKKALITSKNLQENPEFYPVLLSIYQVIAQEQENLSHYSDSESSYQKALNLAKKTQNSEVFEQISSRYRFLQSKMSSFLLDSGRTQGLKSKRMASFTPKLENKVKKYDIYSVTPYLDKEERLKLKNRSLAVNSRNRRLSNFSSKFKIFSKDEEVKKVKGLKTKGYLKGRKTEKRPAKTPEITPVPFRSKLLIFNTNES